MQSSSIRSKAAFVPWLAALVFGAAANTGWLLHELRDCDADGSQAIEVVVNIELDRFNTDEVWGDEKIQRSVEHRKTALRQRARRRARARAHHGHLLEADFVLSFDEPEHLSNWVEQRAAYTYTIDRQALDYFAPAGLTIDRTRFEAIASALDLSQAIELRNIRGGTPLWTLGLRNGDRLVTLRTEGEAEVARVILAIERRGRPVALTYELV